MFSGWLRNISFCADDAVSSFSPMQFPAFPNQFFLFLVSRQADWPFPQSPLPTGRRPDHNQEERRATTACVSPVAALIPRAACDSRWLPLCRCSISLAAFMISPLAASL
ncbi:hypothetical protein Drorol1_Dr00012550 [Drosera rotundifolia]